MSFLFATAGSRLFIGAPLPFPGVEMVAADFSSQAWTQIGGITNLGSAGDTAELITSNTIDDARTRKIKGTKNAGSMQTVANLDHSDPGQLALIAAEKTKYSYAFRVVFSDAPPPRSHTATMTIAAPGVVTWTAHDLSVGDKVKFATTGALPTGLTAGTEYFVQSVPDADTFTLAATKGGSAITTSGTQSGTHTATTVPTASERLFVALVMSASEQWDEANSVMALNGTLEIDSNIVRVAPTGA